METPTPPVRLKPPCDQIYSAQFPDGESVYVAVSRDPQGHRRVRGLDAQMREVWNYENLPDGVFTSRVRFVTSGELSIGGKLTSVWVMAGPDGSVHIISHDGRFNDFFYLGEGVHGLALLRDADRSLLLLATEDAVRAYSMKAPAPSKP